MRFLIILVTCLVCLAKPSSILAQEFIGMNIDNYTPANAMLLNPSAIVDQKPWLDVHLVGVGAHATNNFLYIPKSTLLRFSQYGTATINLDRNKGWGQINAQVLGPSASLSLGKQSFGLHTSLRAASSMNKIPLAYARLFMTNSLPSTEKYEVNNTRVKTLAWGEIGLTYGRILHQFDKNFLTGGITVNRLFGFQSAALFIDKGDLWVENGLIDSLSGNGKYAYTAPSLRAGGGWSTSIGVTYKRMIKDISEYLPHGKEVGCHTLPYKWKLSASLVDLGGIRMKQGALYKKFSSDDNPADYLNGSAVGFGGLSVPRDGDRYIAWLPMGVSGQLDYNFENGIFLNGLIVQRLSLPSSYGPDRSNLIAFTPRYEKKWLMVAMPLSLENYKDPHLGLALRLWVLSIGTEHIFPFFVPSDIHTADVYMHLRLRLYRGPGCRTKPYKSMEEFKFKDLFTPNDQQLDACPDW